MNFIIYYGSTKKQNMKRILDILIRELEDRGHSYSVIDKPVSFCTNCGVCKTTKQCCVKDDFSHTNVNNSDGIILLSPIFFFSFSAKTKAFLDRLYSIKLEGKILTAITLSGSDTESLYCGFDIVNEILLRTSEYCGCIYVPPINFVTGDKKLKTIDESDIESFVKNLEV